MAVHDVAQEGFGNEADAYERVRQSYPPEAVAWLVDGLRIGPHSRVADVAAGTGKLTRLLPTATQVVAIEPVAGMRAALRTVLPKTPLIAGVAEALPLRTGCFEAVTVAQAFHWFNRKLAGAEIARVLQPSGRLGVLWSSQTRDNDFLAQLWAIVDTTEHDAPWRSDQRWRESADEALPGFVVRDSIQFRQEQLLTPTGVVDRIASVSHVAVLSEAHRAALLGQVRDLVANHPLTRGHDTIGIHYDVDVMWCEPQ